MAGLRAGNVKAGKDAPKGLAAGKGKLHGAGNCGTGKGGFKPGNVCGRGGRGKLAADIRASRGSAANPADHAALREKVRALKAHRRGKAGSVDHATAKAHREGLRPAVGAGKSPAGKADGPALRHTAARVDFDFVAGATHADIASASRAIFGREVSAQHLASATGAPDDARVIVGRSGGGSILMTFMGKGPDGKGFYSAAREFVARPDGPAMINHGIHLSTALQGKGLGARIFGQQAEHAAALGVKKIETLAARDPSAGQFGYNVWPKFGYDGPIPAATMAHAAELPAPLGGATRVGELMRSPEGRAFWKERGADVEMEFDPRPGSQSRRVWDEYRKAKGPA